VTPEQDGGFAVQVQAPRNVRDLALFTLVAAATLVVIDRLLWTPDTILVVWIGGGVVAGCCLVLPPRRWWLVLLPYAVTAAAAVHLIGMQWALSAVAGLLELVSILAYVAVVRRHPSDRTGLGADLLWVSLGLTATAVTRIAYLWAAAAVFDGLMAQRFHEYWAVLALATTAGLLVGVPLVLAVGAWRRAPIRDEDRAFSLGVALLTAAIVAVVFLWYPVPLPGEEYVVVPVLLWAAVRCSVAFNAVLTSTTAVVIAISYAQGWGMYATAPIDVDSMVHLQAFLILVVLSRTLVTAAIEARRAAERRSDATAEDLERLVDLSPVAAALVSVPEDGAPRVTAVNEAFRGTVGAVRPGDSLFDLLGLAPDLDLDELAETDVPAVGRDGAHLWLRASVSPLQSSDADGSRRAVVAFEDVTSSKAFENLTRFQAHRDALTGLANRSELLDRLERAVGDGGRTSLGLVLLDLNGLSSVNDALGHVAGDEVVAAVARRLRDASHAGDLVVRFSGDEFALLRDDVATADDLEAWGRALLDAVRAPVLLGGREVMMTASAGCAFTDDVDARERDVLRAADSALRQAKHAGRNQLARNEVSSAERSTVRLDLEIGLHRALDEGRLIALFQPVVEVGTGRTVAVEALARMRDDDGTLLAPSVFLPLAEELGLMGRLTEIVLRQSLDAVAAWRRAGHGLYVAVNVQPTWLTDATAAYVRAEIAARGLEPDCLVLEITEDQTVDLTGPTLDLLRELTDIGVRVAIDDFGTGYAGLSSFRSLPASIVKIDRVFVASMLDRREDLDLVRSVIDLAHRFGKRVVAEGVETQEEYEALRSLECDLVQGWLTGRPVQFADVPLPHVPPQGRRRRDRTRAGTGRPA
jgi:diguanylate cyclase (GGDEF)-like protein